MFVFQQEVEFTRDGHVFNEGQAGAILDAAAGVTDLLVLSRGWNNDVAEARALYDALTANLTKLIQANVLQAVAGCTFGAVRVLWPSKRLADEDLIPGGGAASATKENDEALLRLLEELKRHPMRLGDPDTDPVREASLSRAQALVPSLEAEVAARREFVLLLRAILDASQAHPDDGSEEFFARHPEELFNHLDQTVL